MSARAGISMVLVPLFPPFLPLGTAKTVQGTIVVTTCHGTCQC